MAIRMRRGNEADLDKTKLVSGEIAVSVDADKVRVSKGNGETIDLATQDDLRNIIKLDGGVTIEENTLVISPEEETTEEQGTPVDIESISIDGGMTDNPIKDATARADISSVGGRVTTLEGKIGANNGIAPLDSTGRVPSSNLPSYVDDVIEGYYKVADGKFYKESTYTTEITPESGKIYVSIDTNKEYRWGGSTYVEIASALALGETQGTAYEGSKGKANADNIADIQSVIPANASTSNKLATMEDVGGADYKGVEALIKTTVGFATKNILNCDIASGEHTKNGLTVYVTRQANGQIASISVNGTATAKTYIEVASSVPQIAANAYILNGCPSDGSSSSYGLMIEGSYGAEFTDYGSGVLIQRNVVNGKVYIVIANGYTADHLYFYPMIRDKNVADDTYEGYRENVKSLIDKKADASDVPTALSDLTEDSTHRLVTDVEKSAWNNKVNETLLNDTVGWTGKNKVKSYKVETFTEQYYRALNIDVELQPSTSYILSLDTDNSGNRYYANDTIFNGIDPITADGTRKVVTLTTKSTLDTSQYNLANGGWYVLKNYTAQSSAPSFTNVMITDASILDPTYEPYHESVESVLETKGDWDARNLFNPYGTRINNGAVATITNDGESINVKSSEAGTYKAVGIAVSAKQNTDYVIDVDVDVVSGRGHIKMETLSGTSIYSSSDFTSDGHQRVSFNSGNNDTFRVLLACTWGTSESGEVNYNNLILQKASNVNKSYTEHRKPLDVAIPSKMSYADNGVLGAKNWFDPDRIVSTDGVTCEKTSTGIRMYSTSAGTSRKATWDISNLAKNKKFKLKASLNYTSGTCVIAIRYDSNNYVYISPGYTSNAEIEHIFDRGNYDTFQMLIFCTRETSENGDITLNNFMFSLASDPDDTYAPYAMTNREITEALTVQESAVTLESNISQGQYDRNKIRKQGKICYLNFTFHVETDVSAGGKVATIPNGFRPSETIQGLARMTGGYIDIQCDESGKISPISNLSSGKNVQVIFTWITS